MGSGLFVLLVISATESFSHIKGNVSLRESLSPLCGMDNNRRNFFNKVGTTVAVTTFLPNPAHALGGGIKKVNAKLVQYGVPPIKELPSGFSPLAEVWGIGKNRDPLLVSFVHPVDWVVTLP